MRLPTCITALSGVLFCCAVWVPPEPVLAADISPSAIASLLPIAELHPCAALVVLYTSRIPPSSHSGVIYLEAMPSVRVITLLTSESDASLVGSVESVSLSPYAGTHYLIEVSWSLHEIDSAATILTTEVQLVDQVGEPLQPAHWLEPPTRVLISGGLFRLLGSPGDL
jgi:hypothetical protein